MEEKQTNDKEALQELFRLMADNPGFVKKIVITIEPSKVMQGTDKK